MIQRDLQQKIAEAISAAQEAGDLPDFVAPPIPVTRPRSADHGDYATPVAMPLASIARMGPPQIAAAIVQHFPDTDYIASVEQAGGFINFRLDEGWLQQQVDAIIEAGNAYAQRADFAGQRAQVECVSANPTGPIHVGRIRGGIIGDVMARLLAAVGYSTEMEYYYNNAGKQMDRLAASLRARYLERLDQPFDFPEDGYQGDYLVDVADALIEERGETLADVDDLTPFREFGEKVISAEQKATLGRVNITFDNYFNERTLYSGSIDATLEALDERNLIYKATHPERAEDAPERPDAEEIEATASGEATWLRVTQLRAAPKDVALVRSDGTPTYRLPDIAYHVNKFDRGFDLLINILGADHLDEARDIKAAVGALGYDEKALNYIIHQFVRVIREGEVIAGSTRAGEFVTVDELVDMLAEGSTEAFAIDAVRYFFLARSPNSEMSFDIDLAKSRSNDNPVYYVQNAHVRCAGIEREADAREIGYEGGDVSLLTDPRELDLIRKMLELPEIIDLAVETREPHRLAFWANEELASTFHPTYDEIRALHGDVPEDLAKARLKLFKAAQIVLQRTLDLMGMSAPERM